MGQQRTIEAFVIGSGPNGLTAAITLAKAGVPVTVLESQDSIGGGARSSELTLSGFTHDLCSAVYPMALASPAFRNFPLSEHGLEWVHPPLPCAHPLDRGGAVLVDRSVDATSAGLDADSAPYKRVFGQLVESWPELSADILAPPRLPRHPVRFANFGMRAIWPAASVARSTFRTGEARALFAGMAAHSVTPLEMAGSAAAGWVLGLLAHAVGWPFARGGAQSIPNALASYLKSLGGKIVTNQEVRSLREFPADALVLADVTPKQLLRIAGDQLPGWYQLKLERFRYGPGAFKVDWALSAPIPWANSECARAGTVHLGGTLDEIAASERAAWRGESCERPFVLLAQPSRFDALRAPAGRHTAWAYCHVPNGSAEDWTSRIEAQVERFAPGFRDVILARHTMSPAQLEARNPNLIGGDIGGGAMNLGQLFLRPTASLYRTPLRNLFLCSSSTPPGGGVHGMCGYHAARAALRAKAT